MTDDEILEAIDRRLADIETRLPPQRLTSLSDVDGRLTLRHRSGSKVAAGPALIGLAAVIATVAAFGLSGNRPNVAIPPSDSHGAAIASPSESLQPSAARSPSGAILEVIRNETWDGDAVLIQRLHWGPCFVSADAMRILPDGRLLDEAIDRDGVSEGFVTMDNGKSRFWVGPTAESAARGYGSPILVIDRLSTAWIVSPTGYEQDPVGFQMYRIDTPKGRSGWFLGNSFRQVSCSGG
jgi:hypothetical protein